MGVQICLTQKLNCSEICCNKKLNEIQQEGDEKLGVQDEQNFSPTWGTDNRIKENPSKVIDVMNERNKYKNKFFGNIKVENTITNNIFNKTQTENLEKNKSKELEEMVPQNEGSLYFNMSMKGSFFTSKSLDLSGVAKSSKSVNYNPFVFSQVIFPFILKSKMNTKYKYLGHSLTKISNKSSKRLQVPGRENKHLVKSGFGKLTFEDNTVFRCKFINNKANGFGKFFDQNKDEEFVGEYLNNILNGFGIYNNLLREIQGIGYFKVNGLYDHAVEINKMEGYKYYGEFKKNLKHGIGTIKWDEGTIYEGQFFQNQMTGWGIIKFPGGIVFKGNLNNGKMNGYGEFYWENGKRYFGNYRDDIKDGFGIFIWDNTKLKVEQIENIYFTNCDLLDISAYIGFWLNGQMNGYGIKTNLREVKYGVWKNGAREKWIENNIHLRNYLSGVQKKYLKIFSAEHSEITNLIRKLASIKP